MGSDTEKLGIIGKEIVDAFNLSIKPNTPIYIGLHNRIHMDNNHSDIYVEFADRMSDIIKNPDYVGINPHDDSLEYYRTFGEITIHIKIAVRPTKNGVYFAKTMYDVNDFSLKCYLRKGRIKPV